ncbi:MAG: hypothetical protein AB7O65_04645 [Candidatus Korobacteraceae bacterium]
MLALPSFLYPQDALGVTAHSLEEMVGKAERIVHGTVVNTRVEPHPRFQNLTTLLVTIRVREALKGEPGELLEFRQFVWNFTNQANAAGYNKGQELLILLNPVSAYGLTSPVGLHSGLFRIEQAGQEPVATNGNANAGLFSTSQQRPVTSGTQQVTSSVQTTTGGAVPLTELKQAIRALAGNESP